ncbi:MAG TPA: hypothetical protein VLK29_06195 [Luteimonas sp.]|nr:hypothetical protein [Luteimonas sp.]
MPASARGPSGDRTGIDPLQGAWWSQCDDAAAVFVISGDQYSGDFSGRHRLQLAGGVLVLEDGLPEGHGIDTSGVPLRFRVLKATRRQLVLRLVPGNPSEEDWVLVSCDGR